MIPAEASNRIARANNKGVNHELVSRSIEKVRGVRRAGAAKRILDVLPHQLRHRSRAEPHRRLDRDFQPSSGRWTAPRALFLGGPDTEYRCDGAQAARHRSHWMVDTHRFDSRYWRHCSPYLYGAR